MENRKFSSDHFLRMFLPMQKKKKARISGDPGQNSDSILNYFIRAPTFL